MRIVKYLFDIHQEIIPTVLFFSRWKNVIKESFKKNQSPIYTIRNYKLDGMGRSGFKKYIVTAVQDI